MLTGQLYSEAKPMNINVTRNIRRRSPLINASVNCIPQNQFEQEQQMLCQLAFIIGTYMILIISFKLSHSVTLKMGQGHQNGYEHVKLTRGYHQEESQIYHFLMI